jgi:ribosome maturation factor RimP
MTRAADEKTLWTLCERALAGLGYDLVELEFRRETQGWVLRLYIDRLPDADPTLPKVTLEDCARASRDVSAILDAADPIEQHYALEVSSPGVDRPLRRERDFARFAGRVAHIKLRTAPPSTAGRKNFKGVLAGAAGGEVAIDCDGRRWALPIDDVQRAWLDVDAELERARQVTEAHDGQG